MNVSELIKVLSDLDPDRPVVLCNLEDDGDGDGNALLHQIVSVEPETAINNDQNVNVILICYRD